MRDRLASLIVVKQEGGSNRIGSHHQPAIKCEASLYEGGLYHEINNNSCYRQNLNNNNTQQHTQQQSQHQHQQQQQHLLPPPLPPLIYPCRNLFPDGCDITHLACCSSSSSSSISSTCSSSSCTTTNTNTCNNSHFFANGNTCMYLLFFSGDGFSLAFISNSLIAHAAYTQYEAGAHCQIAQEAPAFR